MELLPSSAPTPLDQMAAWNRLWDAMLAEGDQTVPVLSNDPIVLEEIVDRAEAA